MKRDKVLLIYNPYAGSGMFKAKLDRIIELFQRKKLIVVPVRIDKNQMIKEAISDVKKSGDYRKIIAAGGDGTINIVVNHMMNAQLDLPLAIFPAGTANDFASYYNIPFDIDTMAQVALEDDYVYCDLGLMNDEKYFVNVAAIGSLVDLSQKVDPNVKSILGRMSYYLMGASELTKLASLAVAVKSEEYSSVEQIYFMLVMNNKIAGGIKKLSPMSNMNDGLFEVIIFTETPLTEWPHLILDFAQGNHISNKNVLHFHTKRIKIQSEREIGTDVDGESGCEFPLDIRCLPNAIKIIAFKEDEEMYI